MPQPPKPQSTGRPSNDKRLAFKAKFLKLLEDDDLVLSADGNAELRNLIREAQQKGFVDSSFMGKYDAYHTARYKQVASTPLVDSVTGEAVTKTVPAPRQFDPQTKTYKSPGMKTVPMTGSDLVVGGGLYVNATPESVNKARVKLLESRVAETASEVEKYQKIKDILEPKTLGGKARLAGAGYAGVGQGLLDAARITAAGIPGIGEIVKPPSLDQMSKRYTVQDLDTVTPETALEGAGAPGRAIGLGFGTQLGSVIGGVSGSQAGAGLAALALGASPLAPVLVPLAIGAGSLGGALALGAGQSKLMERAYGPEGFKQFKGIEATAYNQAPGSRLIGDLAATVLQGSPTLASGIGMRGFNRLIGATARSQAIGIQGTAKQLGAGAQQLDDAAKLMQMANGPGSKFDTVVSNFLQRTGAAGLKTAETSYKVFTPTASTMAGRFRELGTFINTTPSAAEFLGDAIGEQGINLAMSAVRYKKNLDDYNNDTTGLAEKPSALEALIDLGIGSLFIGNNRLTNAISRGGEKLFGGAVGLAEKIPGVSQGVEAAKIRFAVGQQGVYDEFRRKNVLDIVQGKVRPSSEADFGIRTRLRSDETQNVPTTESERLISLGNGRAIAFDTVLGTTREVPFSQAFGTVDDTASLEQNKAIANALSQIPTVHTDSILGRRFGIGGQQGRQAVRQEGAAKQSVSGIVNIDNEGYVVVREVPDIVTEQGEAKRGLTPIYSVVRVEDIDQPGNKSVAQRMIADAGLKPATKQLKSNDFSENIMREQYQIAIAEAAMQGPSKGKTPKEGPILKEFPSLIRLDKNLQVRGRVVGIENNGDLKVQLLALKDTFIRIDPVNVEKAQISRSGEIPEPIAMSDLMGELDMSASAMPKWDRKFNIFDTPDVPLMTVPNVNAPILLTQDQMAKVPSAYDLFTNGLEQIDRLISDPKQKEQAKQRLQIKIEQQVFGEQISESTKDFVIGSVIDVVNQDGNSEKGIVLNNTSVGPIVYLESLGGRPVIIQPNNIIRGESVDRVQAKTQEKVDTVKPTPKSVVDQILRPEPAPKTPKASPAPSEKRTEVGEKQIRFLIGSDTVASFNGNEIPIVVTQADGTNVNLAQAVVSFVAQNPGVELNEQQLQIIEATGMPKPERNRKWYQAAHQQISYLNDPEIRSAVDQISSGIPDVNFDALQRGGFATTDSAGSPIIDTDAVNNIVNNQQLGFRVAALAQTAASMSTPEGSVIASSALNGIRQSITIGNQQIVFDAQRTVVDRESFKNELLRMLSQIQGIEIPISPAKLRQNNVSVAAVNPDLSVFSLFQSRIPLDIFIDNKSFIRTIDSVLREAKTKSEKANALIDLIAKNPEILTNKNNGFTWKANVSDDSIRQVTNSLMSFIDMIDSGVIPDHDIFKTVVSVSNSGFLNTGITNTDIDFEIPDVEAIKDAFPPQPVLDKPENEKINIQLVNLLAKLSAIKMGRSLDKNDIEILRNISNGFIYSIQKDTKELAGRKVTPELISKAQTQAGYNRLARIFIRGEISKRNIVQYPVGAQLSNGKFVSEKEFKSGIYSKVELPKFEGQIAETKPDGKPQPIYSKNIDALTASEKQQIEDHVQLLVGLLDVDISPDDVRTVITAASQQEIIPNMDEVFTAFNNLPKDFQTSDTLIQLAFLTYHQNPILKSILESNDQFMLSDNDVSDIVTSKELEDGTLAFLVGNKSTRFGNVSLGGLNAFLVVNPDNQKPMIAFRNSDGTPANIVFDIEDDLGVTDGEMATVKSRLERLVAEDAVRKEKQLPYFDVPKDVEAGVTIEVTPDIQKQPIAKQKEARKATRKKKTIAEETAAIKPPRVERPLAQSTASIASPRIIKRYSERPFVFVDESGRTIVDANGNPFVGIRKKSNSYLFPTLQQWLDAGLPEDTYQDSANNWESNVVERTRLDRTVQQIYAGKIFNQKTNRWYKNERSNILGRFKDNRKQLDKQVSLPTGAVIGPDLYSYDGPTINQDSYSTLGSNQQIGVTPALKANKDLLEAVYVRDRLSDGGLPEKLRRLRSVGVSVPTEQIGSVLENEDALQNLLFEAIDKKIEELKQTVIALDQAAIRAWTLGQHMNTLPNNGRLVEMDFAVPVSLPEGFNDTEIQGDPVDTRTQNVELQANAIADLFDTFIHAAQSRRINMFVEAMEKDYFSGIGVSGRTLQKSGSARGVIRYTSTIERDLLPIANQFQSEWEKATGNKLSFSQISQMFRFVQSDSETDSAVRQKDKVTIENILENIAQNETNSFYRERMPVFANFGDTIPTIAGLNGAYMNIYDPNNKTSTKVLMAFGSANFSTFVEEVSHAFLEALPVGLKEDLASAMRMELRIPTITNPSVLPMEMQEEFASSLMASISSGSFTGQRSGRKAISQLARVLDPVQNVLDETFILLGQRTASSRAIKPIRVQNGTRELLWEVPFTSRKGSDPNRNVYLYANAPVVLYDGRVGLALKEYGTKGKADNVIPVSIEGSVHEVTLGDIKSIGGYTKGLNPEVMQVLSNWIGSRRRGVGVGISTPESRSRRAHINDDGSITYERNVSGLSRVNTRTSAGIQKFLSEFGMPFSGQIKWDTFSRFIDPENLNRIWNHESMMAMGSEYSRDPIGSVKKNKDIASVVDAYARSRVFDLVSRILTSGNFNERNNAQKIINSIDSPSKTSAFNRAVAAYHKSIHFNRVIQDSIKDTLNDIRNNKAIIRVSDDANNVFIVEVDVNDSGQPKISKNGDIVVTLFETTKTGRKKSQVTGYKITVNLETGNVIGNSKFVDNGLLSGGVISPIDSKKQIVILDSTRLDANKDIGTRLSAVGIQTSVLTPRVPHKLYWVAKEMLTNMGAFQSDAAWNSYSPLVPKAVPVINILGQASGDENANPFIFGSVQNIGAEQSIPVPTNSTVASISGLQSPVATNNPNRVVVNVEGRGFIGSNFGSVRNLYDVAVESLQRGDDRPIAYLGRVLESEIQTAFDGIKFEGNVEFASSLINSIEGQDDFRLSGSFEIKKRAISDVLLRAAYIGRKTQQANVFVTARAGGKQSFGQILDSGATIVPSISVSLKSPINHVALSEFASKNQTIGNGGKISLDGKTLTLFMTPTKEFGINEANSWIRAATESITKQFGESVDAISTEKLKFWSIGSSEFGGQGTFVEYGRLLDSVPDYTVVDPAIQGRQIGSPVAGRLRKELGRTLSIFAGKDLVLPKKAKFNREVIPQEVRQRIATAYDLLDVESDDEQVKVAYEALAKELEKQFAVSGLTVDFMDVQRDGDSIVLIDPYKNNPKSAISDVVVNRHISIRKSEFDPNSKLIKHSILGRKTRFKTRSGETLTVNDLLRAIHDSLAYASNDTTFGKNSEDLAYIAHASITEDVMAMWALAMETRVRNIWFDSNGYSNNVDGIARTDAPELQRFQDKDGLIDFNALYTGVPLIDDRLRLWANDKTKSKSNYKGTKDVVPIIRNGPLDIAGTEAIVLEDDSVEDSAQINVSQAIVTVAPGSLNPSVTSTGIPQRTALIPVPTPVAPTAQATAARRPLTVTRHQASAAQKALGIVNTILRQGAGGDASPILIQNWGLANFAVNPNMLAREFQLIGQVLFNPNVGIQLKDGRILNRDGMRGRKMAIDVTNREIRSQSSYSIMEEAGMFLAAYKADEALYQLQKTNPSATLMDVSEIGYDTDIRDDGGVTQHWPGQAMSERFYTLSRDLTKMNAAHNFVQHLVDIGYNPTELFEKDSNGNYLLDEDGKAIPVKSPFANALRDLAHVMNVMTGDVRMRVDDIDDERVVRLAKLLMYSPRWTTSRLLLTSIGRGMLKSAFENTGVKGAEFIQSVFEANGVSERQLANRDPRVAALQARLLWKSWLTWLAMLASVYGTNVLYPHTLGVSVDKLGTRLKIGDYSFRMPGATATFLEIAASVYDSIGKWEQRKGEYGEESFVSFAFNNVSRMFMTRTSPIVRVASEVATGRDVFGAPAFATDEAAKVFWEEAVIPTLSSAGIEATKDSPLSKFIVGAASLPISKYVMWWPIRDAIDVFNEQRQLSIDRQEALTHSIFLGAFSGIGGRISYTPEELKWRSERDKNMEVDRSDPLSYFLGGTPEMVGDDANLYEPSDIDLYTQQEDFRIGAPVDELGV